MARVVVVETVYYQDEGCQPSSVDLGFARPATREQPFTRRMAFQGSTVVECGWVEKCCLMALKNVGRIEVSVQFGAAGLPCYLAPGETLRIRPEQPKEVYLHSISEAKVEVFLYPG